MKLVCDVCLRDILWDDLFCINCFSKWIKSSIVETPACDKSFLSNVKYFWQNKESLERYSDFSIDRLKRLDWKTANAYINYMQAKKSLDYNIDNIND